MYYSAVCCALVLISFTFCIKLTYKKCHFSITYNNGEMKDG